MSTLRLLQTAMIAGVVALPAYASAQTFGADPVTGGVCGLINFQFCPQNPPVPVAPFPDPERDAERAVRPIAPPPPGPVSYVPAPHRHHGRLHRLRRHAAQ